MLPDLAGSPAFCRKLLACWLCTLALVFAFEAKTAWYGPAAGPGCAVRAAKALPADSSQVVLHGVPAPDPVHPALPFLIFAVFVLAPSAGTAFHMTRLANRGALTPASAPFFSPQLFFRPPPVL
ncbi:MAG: hypothetical protein ACLQHF_14745 [Terracidiphilus sp.]